MLKIIIIKSFRISVNTEIVYKKKPIHRTEKEYKYNFKWYQSVILYK